MQIRVARQVTDARMRDLERDLYQMERLMDDLDTARAEVREYQERQAALEEHVRITERRLAKFQGTSTSSPAPLDPTRRGKYPFTRYHHDFPLYTTMCIISYIIK